MRYTLTVETDGAEWAVVETDTTDGVERTIARCRERDDANLICEMFSRVEAGSIG